MDYKDFARHFVFGSERGRADDCLSCADNLEVFVRRHYAGTPVDVPLTPKGRGIANICRYCINLLRQSDSVVLVGNETETGYCFTLARKDSDSRAVFEFRHEGEKYDGSLVLKPVNDKFRVDNRTKIAPQAEQVVLYLERPRTYQKKKKTTKLSQRSSKVRPDSGLYQ